MSNTLFSSSSPSFGDATVSATTTPEQRAEAGLLLAEVNYLLTLKQESHTLNDDDKKWLGITSYHAIQHPELDKAKIKLEISLARLTNREYQSIITREKINKDTLEMAQYHVNQKTN